MPRNHRLGWSCSKQDLVLLFVFKGQGFQWEVSAAVGTNNASSGLSCSSSSFVKPGPRSPEDSFKYFSLSRWAPCAEAVEAEAAENALGVLGQRSASSLQKAALKDQCMILHSSTWVPDLKFAVRGNFPSGYFQLSLCRLSNFSDTRMIRILMRETPQTGNLNSRKPSNPKQNRQNRIRSQEDFVPKSLAERLALATKTQQGL